MSTDKQTQGTVETIVRKTTYQKEPLAVYNQLCAGQANTLLLESAEIDKKHQLKSLLLTKAAVKLVCQQNSVELYPLTENGKAAVDEVTSALEGTCQINASADKTTLSFAKPDANLDEHQRLKSANVFQALRQFTTFENLTNHPFGVFLAGTFAFDLIACAEELPAVAEGANTCPDYAFYLAEHMVLIDHETQSCEVLGNVFSKETDIKAAITQGVEQLANALERPIASIQTQENVAATAVEASVDISDQAFCDIVEQLKQNIVAGDIFQVVPSRTFSLPCSNALLAYNALKQSNPSPYMFYVQDEDFTIFGASPESALKYQHQSRQVEIYPIAGTRPRGFDQHGNISLDLDSRIELDLRLNEKELAEHIMLVDLARNDIARVSKPGTRHIADLLKVDRYSHVMHLVSRVCGELQDDLDALQAYQACMNMGTLSGAPKVKATQLIRDQEQHRRGSYGGAVGYLTGEGEMDTCIVIRSAFVKDDMAHIQAGAGVVFDSVAQAEADETRQKAQAVINAIKTASQLEAI
ncbi:anthranilate synthase component 1 [Thalassotalea agarivorans]|uniref:Anthranilate synthase component 1 n=1 Tax=Thalassotalea agarivorans TaxID=349064 RepID=A0A1I0EMS1_THASX|nr:anthranilate synthase component 1 [Thalassotalea agarivorans]SET46552.1 anthranilate synthase, component I [Thalassotalea agarivorans]